MQAAAPAVAHAFLGDLRSGALLLAGIGAVVAAAAASVLRPRPIADRMRAALRLAADEPRTPAWRVVRGLGLVAAGVLAIAAPATALRLLMMVAGLIAPVRRRRGAAAAHLPSARGTGRPPRPALGSSRPPARR